MYVNRLISAAQLGKWQVVLLICLNSRHRLQDGRGEVVADAGAVPPRRVRRRRHLHRRREHRAARADQAALAHHHHPAGPRPVLGHPQDEPR